VNPVRPLSLLLLALTLHGAETPGDAVRKVREALADNLGAPTRTRVAELYHSAKPDDRTAILAAVADAKAPWAGGMASEALDDADAGVRAMAISALSRAWPTGLDDVDRVRRLVGDGDPRVVQSAAGFLGRVGDDGALPALVDRLDSDKTGAIRKAIESLAKPPGPTPVDAAGWREVLAAREARLAPLAETLRTSIRTKDMAAAHQAIADLLLLRDQRVAVGTLLAEAATSGNPNLARVAREGLGLLGGPVAACLPPAPDDAAHAPALTQGRGTSQAPSSAAMEAPAAGTSLDPVALGFGIAILAIVGGIGWMLAQAKPVRDATRRIARVASERIAKPMASGTRRIARPAGAKVKKLTDRFTRAKPPAP